jgi:hypothetical protein
MTQSVQTCLVSNSKNDCARTAQGGAGRTRRGTERGLARRRAEGSPRGQSHFGRASLSRLRRLSRDGGRRLVALGRPRRRAGDEEENARRQHGPRRLSHKFNALVAKISQDGEKIRARYRVGDPVETNASSKPPARGRRLGPPDDLSFIFDLKAAGLMSDCAHSSAPEWKTIHARSWRFNLAEAVWSDRFE